MQCNILSWTLSNAADNNGWKRANNCWRSTSPRSTYKAKQLVSLRLCRTWMYSDGQLRMSDHVAAQCRTCFFQLRQIHAIRRSLTLDAKKTLVNAFVASHMDYCNSLYHGIGEGLLHGHIAASAECGDMTRHWSSEIWPHNSGSSCPAVAPCASTNPSFSSK